MALPIFWYQFNYIQVILSAGPLYPESSRDRTPNSCLRTPFSCLVCDLEGLPTPCHFLDSQCNLTPQISTKPSKAIPGNAALEKGNVTTSLEDEESRF